MIFPLLTSEHVDSTCRPGAGPQTCRYLGCDADGWRCLKLNASLSVLLDQRVALGTMNARGDNCEGRTR